MNRLLLLGLIGLALLCVLCPYCRAPAIEEDLHGKALACIDEADLDADIVSISGRDITLTGIVPSQAVSDQIKDCITGIPGVRVVYNQLEIAGVLGFRTHYGDITLWGDVPSEADRTDLVDEAVALWGVDNVTAELEVHPNRSVGPWPDSFAPGLAALHQYREDLDVELSGGRAVLSGTVVSELTRERVLGGAATNLPGFEIVDRLTIREPADDREVLQASLDNLLAGKVVEFATDSADLTAKGRAVLDEVVAILKAEPGRVEISGHTDSRQTLAYNIELSQKRAEAVKRYFVAKGLDSDRFDTAGYGETRPIASNDTPEGQQKNRRTEFHALKEN